MTSPLLRRRLSRTTSHERTKRRRITPALECLECRLVLSPTIVLDPLNDEFGSQIQTVTQFGDANRVTLGILDTGASPVTVSPDDQASFGDPNGNPDPIPILVPGGASADGIGGGVTGDVSQPISVLTDGLHAASLNINFNTFSFTVSGNFTDQSARLDGAQVFVGTPNGSPDLPTISGTPIFAGGFNSPSATDQLAAKVDLINGVDFYGLGLLEPDVNFVPATSTLTPGPTEESATLALAPIGTSNVSNPGSDITSHYNFVSNSVQLNFGSQSVPNQSFLVDTGSELTVISTAEAIALGIDLAHPFDTIDVQGVGGSQTINGYIIDSLQVGLVGGDRLTIENVPVFVLDVAPGQIDGILGMNLWNNVDQMLINPSTPSGQGPVPTLSLTWDPNYNAGGGGGGFFYINSLLDHGESTLHDILGNAAQSFHVPSTSAADHTPAKPAPIVPAPGLAAVPVAPATGSGFEHVVVSSTPTLWTAVGIGATAPPTGDTHSVLPSSLAMAVPQPAATVFVAAAGGYQGDAGSVGPPQEYRELPRWQEPEMNLPPHPNSTEIPMEPTAPNPAAVDTVFIESGGAMQAANAATPVIASVEGSRQPASAFVAGAALLFSGYSFTGPARKQDVAERPRRQRVQ
jgi:hypothetical protein